MVDLSSLLYHPIAETYPLLSDAELDSIGRSIKERGLKYKILRWQGRIVDGRNRIRACIRSGIELGEDDFRDLDCPEDELEAELEAYNERRRHLSMEFLKDRREKRLPRVAARRDQGMSLAEIARTEGVSKETIRQDVKKINESQLHDPILPESATVDAQRGQDVVRREAATVADHLPSNGCAPAATVADREPGDDTEEIERERRQEQSRPKNGAERYRWRDFEGAIGGVLREIDRVGNAFDCKNMDQFAGFLERTKTLCADFRKWFTQLNRDKDD